MGAKNNIVPSLTLVNLILANNFKRFYITLERPGLFVSTPFRPLLLMSGAPPFRSAHIAGLFFSR
jgi:hypothetical protein